MDKSNIVIRKVETKDAKQYVELINLVWRLTYKNIFPEEVFLDMKNKNEERIKNFSNNFYNDNTRMCYVAEDDGKIVGVVYGTTKSTYEYFRNQRFADLISLYVLPEYQNRGLGKRFKDVFVDWAKKNNVKKFVKGVLKDNKKARMIYEKWGGKLSLHEEPFYKLDIAYDEVFYIYDL